MTLSELKQAIDARLKRDLKIVNDHYGLDLQMPTVTYDLTGTTAGNANYQTWKLRFNQQLLIDNADRFLDHTVPHELAHLVCDRVYPEAHKRELVVGRNGKLRFTKRDVHGQPWQSVMRVLGIDNPTRCHSYDVSNVKHSDPNLHDAHCSKCNEVMRITQKRLNKIHRGAQYFHTRCGGALKLGLPNGVKPTIAVKQTNVNAPRIGSKLHQCLRLFQSNSKLSRPQLIALFVAHADCTPKGASTYLSTCQKLTQQGVTC